MLVSLNLTHAFVLGLGKTAQAIVLIDWMISKRHARGPVLVVAPLSTLSFWRRYVFFASVIVAFCSVPVCVLLLSVADEDFFVRARPIMFSLLLRYHFASVLYSAVLRLLRIFFGSFCCVV